MLFSRKKKPAAQSLHRYRPHLEILEDRLTPTSMDFGFALAIGGTASDEGHAVATDPDGNVYVTGFNISGGERNCLVAKYTATGTLDWARTLGGSIDAYGFDIVVDSDGNVYTTGFFYGTVDFDPGDGTFILTSAGSADVFVSKLDSAGNFVWARGLGSGDNSGDVGRGIAVDSAGNVCITGRFFGTADFDPGFGIFNLTSSGSADCFVWKLDNAGSFVWALAVGGSDSDNGSDIAVDGEGNVCLIGEFRETVDFDPGASTFNLGSPSTHDVFVLKCDSAGNFVWACSTGGYGGDFGNGITVDSAGNVYTTGAFAATADFDPGPGIFNLSSVTDGGRDVFVWKLDSTGNFVWARKMGGVADEVGFGITVDSTGNVYTTGFFYGTVDFDPGDGTFNLATADAAQGRSDIFVSKLDSDGNFVFACAMGGSEGDGAYGIAVGSLGSVYTTGLFGAGGEPLLATADFDPGLGTFNLTSSGSTDIFLSKLVNNRPPQANAGGPYSINEGEAIALNGGNSSDPDADTLTISWDLDGDGNFEDALGLNPLIPWATLRTLGLRDGHAEHTIRVRVTDTANKSDTATATLVIHNSPPALTVADNSVAVNEGTPAINSGTFQDPGDDSVTITASAGTIMQDDGMGTWAWSWPTTEPSQSQTVTITATDNDGDSSSVTFTLTVNNQPPTAHAGGAYAVVEGNGLALDASGSSDPDDPLSYFWDVNGDGAFGDVTGMNPSLTWAQLQAVGIDEGPNQFAVRVKVDDGNGHVADSLPITLTVTNAPPTPTVVGPTTGVRGQPRSFLLSATDASGADQASGFAYSIAWGDGSPIQTIAATPGNGSGVALDHIFTHVGTFFVQLTAKDKDDGQATVVHAITISAFAMQADPHEPGKTALVVGGTVGNDNILVKPANLVGAITIVINAVSQGNFRPMGRMIVYAQAGNDSVEVRSRMIRNRLVTIRQSAMVHGDDGNDSVNVWGSIANNVLVGGNGDDMLRGGAGRDLLIGGLGRDTLRGNGGQDILVGGTTIHDTDLAALIALMAEWGRRDANFGTRIRHLTGNLVGGVNAPYFLNLATIQDDRQVDVLDGGADRNWLLQ